MRYRKKSPANTVTQLILSLIHISDDGSSLFIDGKNIILVDGIHGPEDMTGSVMLKKGLHEIRMDYFEAGGGEEINFYMEGPGMKKQSVPPSMLFRKKVAE